MSIDSPQLTPTPTDPRTVTVHAYVTLPLPEVFARFQDPGIDGMLTAIGRVILGDRATDLSVHAWPTVWIASGTVRVPMEWRLRSGGRVHEGSATISLLTVQSGSDAITELLMEVPSTEADRVQTRTFARKGLDALADRLGQIGTPAAGRA